MGRHLEDEKNESFINIKVKVIVPSMNAILIFFSFSFVSVKLIKVDLFIYIQCFVSDSEIFLYRLFF